MLVSYFFTIIKGVFYIKDKLVLSPHVEEVRLVNLRQVYFYISEGIQPTRLECGYDEKIVFVFEKEPTLKLFSRWRERDVMWKSELPPTKVGGF